MEMNLDPDKIDNAILALLLLGLHDGVRTWKGFDWESMSRLHEKGFISNPLGKAKSDCFTEAGLAMATKLAEELFAKRDDSASD